MRIKTSGAIRRYRKTKTGRTNMFSGLVYCSDCGERLYYGATNNYRTEGAFFDCSVHWKHKDRCGTHYIREKVLYDLVLQHVQLVTGYSYRMWDTSWRIIRRVGRRAVVGHFGRMDQVWYGKRSVYRKDCSSARGVGRGKIKASNLRRMGL